MTSDQDRMIRRMRELCGEPAADDGIDPRILKRKQERQAQKDGKTRALQLCSQIAQAINLCLSSSSDAVLSQLVVTGVEPAPDISRVRVVVANQPGTEVHPEVALDHLQQASGWLRSEVAEAIHRKKTPGLTFGWKLS